MASSAACIHPMHSAITPSESTTALDAFMVLISSYSTCSHTTFPSDENSEGKQVAAYARQSPLLTTVHDSRG
ncbi:hypothetical protein N7541_011001 [Penicillium brevicompactum]|uniref:Uncharacterized protein n=1 Tax=Penicillium brevicompactum TaxID=5074 RepID=A0A9W9QPK7_PENBR|nr:uncharacterized protein N7506_009263 [Penicillium brevicompactum]KAJ5326161.1 hypothetical protein N7506_009263 [Penicillium brevicompactum]KAJ5341877.1 hypothetical protein N7541_011001 [Penicillium brevicompactum]